MGNSSIVLLHEITAHICKLYGHPLNVSIILFAVYMQIPAILGNSLMKRMNRVVLYFNFTMGKNHSGKTDWFFWLSDIHSLTSYPLCDNIISFLYLCENRITHMHGKLRRAMNPLLLKLSFNPYIRNIFHFITTL